MWDTSFDPNMYIFQHLPRTFLSIWWYFSFKNFLSTNHYISIFLKRKLNFAADTVSSCTFKSFFVLAQLSHSFISNSEQVIRVGLEFFFNFFFHWMLNLVLFSVWIEFILVIGSKLKMIRNNVYLSRWAHVLPGNNIGRYTLYVYHILWKGSFFSNAVCECDKTSFLCFFFLAFVRY